MIGLDLLTRPLTDLLDTFGTGVVPPNGPPEALTIASAALDSAYAIGKLGLAELGGAWSGSAADAAASKGGQAQIQQVQLSERGTEIATVLTAASGDVGAGLAELQGIAASFVSTAVAAGPAVTTPAGQLMIVAAAIDHLSRGLAVVARVRSELAVHTAAMTRLTAPDPGVAPANAGTAEAVVRPASSGPAVPLAGLQQRGDAFGGFARGFADAAAAGSPSNPGYSDFAGALGAGRGGAQPQAAGVRGGSSSDPLGSSGVEVFLPDGSTAMAPNREAADAVRNALSQQGVPYSWGGTTPGQGLDCSGLTQWAYGEAGVDIPRLAQEQSVGSAVDPSDLRPGDLAVWDGHVAMVIGNGQMVEAGDPVQVSSVRTDNIGMSFHGFYRPTA
ncbi:C40 family peptidase [Rhodococcus sp. NPDC054953]